MWRSPIPARKKRMNAGLRREMSEAVFDEAVHDEAFA
jgi:hypothetical protein